MMEEIRFEEKLLAIIIRHEFKKEGVHFFTPPNFSQQVAYMSHPKGKKITPHIHNKVSREVEHTQEVLMIKSGSLRVDFYNKKREYLKSRLLNQGDLILLASGGHGFEVSEDLEMIEIKQGPYAGDDDKTRFTSISPDKIVF